MADDSNKLNFNQRVYALVRRIPRGKVLCYGRVAALLGVPRGARAVGWALHAAPVDGDVPWQRVVNAQGRISARCELHTPFLQKALLQAEGVRFDEEDDLAIVGFRDIMWLPSPDDLCDLA